MEIWQKFLLIIWGALSLTLSIKGFNQSKVKNNVYGLTPYLLPLGIFVWGDAVIFGIFWALSSLVALFLNDWILFLLIFCVFWTVRSLGETIYWFNQQFSPIKRNPPKNLPGYKYFKNDSIWFIYQIIMQCITVISTIFTIYFAKIWF